MNYQSQYTDDLMSTDTKYSKVLLEKIAEILMSHSDIYYTLELMKKELINFAEFDEQEIFKRLDMRGSKQINYNDIRIFMEQNEVFMTTKETKLLFNYLDKEERGHIDYDSLTKLVVPKDYKCQFKKVPLRKKVERLPQGIELLIVDIFKEELSFALEIEAIKKSLDFGVYTVEDVFSELDEEDKGYINPRNLYDFLTDYFDTLTFKMCLEIFEMFKLMRRERMSLSEFCDVLTPKRIHGKKRRRLRSRIKRRKQDIDPRIFESDFMTYHYKERRESVYIHNCESVENLPENSTPRKKLKYDDLEEKIYKTTFRDESQGNCHFPKEETTQGMKEGFRNEEGRIERMHANETKRISKSNLKISKKRENEKRNLKHSKSNIRLKTKSYGLEMKRRNSFTEKGNKSSGFTEYKKNESRKINIPAVPVDMLKPFSSTSIVEPSTGGRVVEKKVPKLEELEEKENNPFINLNNRRSIAELYNSKSSYNSKIQNSKLKQTSCFYYYESDSIRQQQEKQENPTPFDLGSLNKNITHESVDFTSHIPFDSQDENSYSKYKKTFKKGNRILRDNSRKDSYESQDMGAHVDNQFLAEESKETYPLLEKSEINNTVFTVTSKQSVKKPENKNLRKNDETRKYFENLEKADLRSKKNEKKNRIPERMRRHNSTSVLAEKRSNYYNRRQLNTNNSSALLLNSKEKSQTDSDLFRIKYCKPHQYHENPVRNKPNLPTFKAKIDLPVEKKRENVAYFRKNSSELTFTKKSEPSKAQAICFYNPSKQRCTDDDIRNLGEFLIDLIRDFRELENYRQKLSVRPDFNLKDFFKLINEDNSGELSPEDLLELFQSVEIISDIQESLLIIERFDKSRNGKLNYKEFSKLLTPFDGEHQKRLVERGKRGIKSIVHYSDHTLGLIKNVLEILISSEKNCDFHREILNKKKDLLFDILDVEKKGSIKEDELGLFLRKLCFKYTDFDLSFVVDKFDWKENGKISYGEFVNEISPKRFKMPKARVRLNEF